ncbi:hypothetical protein JW968_03255 [Candidatus Woesearchaeota archaeon]|nr:hypothetical protein [Candidatus Woesearchaeota archaeon]
MGKKRDIILLSTILFLLSTLLLTGCSGPSEPHDSVPAHQGTEGLVLRYMQGQPPSRVYNGDQLDVTVELRNRGAFPSQESGEPFIGTIILGGYDPVYLPFSPSYYILDGTELYGKDQYNVEGSYATRTFSVPRVNIPRDVDFYRPTIQATACYEYKTFAAASVCIDPDPWKSGVEDEVCDVTDVSMGSQGAPIAVTRIEEDVTSQDIKFKITFSNSGRGYAYDYMARDACPDIEYVDLDKIDVHSVILSGAEIRGSCTPPNPIKMYNNQGFVVCSAQKPSDETPAYVTPLQITLKYGYMDSIKQQVEVVQS